MRHAESGAPGGSSLVGLLMLDWYERVDSVQRHLYHLQALDGCLSEYSFAQQRYFNHFQSELLGRAEKRLARDIMDACAIQAVLVHDV